MKDAAEIRVGANGSVNVGPVNSAILPANPTVALNAAFIELGYTDENGVTFNSTPSTEDINAWQSADPVRRLVTQRIATVSFNLLQLNQQNFVTAFGGGVWTSPSAGVYKYTPPAPNDALAEVAMVIRVQDGSESDQWTIYRGNITDAVETQVTRTGAQTLPITLSALTPASGGASWDFQSNDATAFGLLS